MSTLPESPKLCNLTEIRERLSHPLLLEEIEFGTAQASDAIRAEIVDGMAKSVAQWQSTPPAPMFVTMLGKWSIRIGHDRQEIDEEARRVLGSLMKLESVRVDAALMADEIEALREERRILRDFLGDAISALEDGHGPDEWTERARAMLPPQ
jgi:hypothetical protein